MNANSERSSTVYARPPKVISALVEGFNTVASHIYLILLPVALDLFLWFGPHLRIQKLFEPPLLDLIAYLRGNSAPEMQNVLNNMSEIWKIFLERFNLFSVFSTFPLGIPSLIAGNAPLESPLGKTQAYQTGSFGQVVLLWLALTLLGYLLGTLYLALIARASRRSEDGESAPVPLNLGLLGWQAAQMIAMVLLVLLALAVLMVPALLISSLLALVSPVIAQFALVLMSFVLVWVLIPLIFSPHGILLYRQHALSAMLNSARVVRFSLSGTGLFLLVAVVLYQGMDLLWRVPPDASWMTLIGIAGHAFISTGLLAASFSYYRSGMDFIQALRKLAAKSAAGAA